MSSRKFKDSMPLAPLKIVALGNQTELGEKINKEIIARRHKALSEMQKPDFKMTGYETILFPMTVQDLVQAKQNVS